MKSNLKKEDKIKMMLIINCTQIYPNLLLAFMHLRIINPIKDIKLIIILIENFLSNRVIEPKKNPMNIYIFL